MIENILKLLVLLIFFVGCSKPTELKEQNFYYWKTSYQLGEAERNTLSLNQTTKIYTRLCDISLEYDKTAHPNNVLKWETQPSQEYQYIPVIFIQNKVFSGWDEEKQATAIRDKKYLDKSTLKDLAKNVYKLTKSSWEYMNIELNEVQIDCDWTESTKESYFYFLEELNKECGGITLSATIRLHQIKYQEKTGIPPIDKASLMCYNLDDMNNTMTENSIFNLKVIKLYVNKKHQYNKIPISLALPVFQWNLAYRDDKFVGIVRNISDDQLVRDFNKLEGNKFKVKQNPSKYKLQWGDIIRHEETNEAELQDALEYLKNKLPYWNGEVIYFDLNKNVTETYEKSILPFPIN
ncbi:MAG: hypothetical protein COA58_00370 [Bacteroidetes bacterium]|nr:MAG: hypothetical protein COA58_00370 [Bacteroidota bacterium]